MHRKNNSQVPASEVLSSSYANHLWRSPESVHQSEAKALKFSCPTRSFIEFRKTSIRSRFSAVSLNARTGPRSERNLFDMAPEQSSTADASVDALFLTIYGELKKTASHLRHQYRDYSLQTTQLVHELYLRLRSGDASFPNKSQFFSYAARAMRSIAIDHARAQMSSVEREQQQFALQELLSDQTLSPALVLAVDKALLRLQKTDPRAAKVVEQHFFLGLNLQEIAEHQELSLRTIERDWHFARAFLHAQLKEP
jgi:RNA polymerase sigma factor (TIGR02999 family)